MILKNICEKVFGTEIKGNTMSERKTYLAIISTLERKAVASKWFTSIAAAQQWSEAYESDEPYLIGIYDEVSDPPVLEYIINPMNI